MEGQCDTTGAICHLDGAVCSQVKYWDRTSDSSLKVLGDSWHQHVPSVSPLSDEGTHHTVYDQGGPPNFYSSCPDPVPASSLPEETGRAPQNLLAVVPVLGSELLCLPNLLCPCTLIPNSDLPRLSGPRLHPGPALVPAVVFSAADQCRSRLPQRLNGRPCLWAHSSCLFAV